MITTLCVARQFLKSTWQQEDVNCHNRSDLSSSQLSIYDKYSLETSDLTYSLRSSSIILPIPISCCANVTLDGIQRVPVVPVTLDGTGGLRLSGGFLPGVVRAEGRVEAGRGSWCGSWCGSRESREGAVQAQHLCFSPYPPSNNGGLLFPSSGTNGTSLTTLACPRW